MSNSHWPHLRKKSFHGTATSLMQSVRSTWGGLERKQSWIHGWTTAQTDGCAKWSGFAHQRFLTHFLLIFKLYQSVNTYSVCKSSIWAQIFHANTSVILRNQGSKEKTLFPSSLWKLLLLFQTQQQNKLKSVWKHWIKIFSVCTRLWVVVMHVHNHVKTANP